MPVYLQRTSIQTDQGAVIVFYGINQFLDIPVEKRWEH
jgi:hypothetical protein